MFEIIDKILFRFQNIIEIIPSELQAFNLNMAIGGGLWFLTFYFVSRWFRAYVIRLGLFILGVFLIWNVTARDHMLDNIDIYVAFGLIIPQIEIVELTYLILKDRTLFIYEKILEFLVLIISPFVWIFNVGRNMFGLFKAKQNEKVNQQTYEKYYHDDFKKQQKKEWRKEQARQDEKAQREFKEQEEKKQQKKKEQYRKYEEQKKQYQETKQKEENKPKSRWDSDNDYEILGIEETATKDEIKKAYRRLARIYHPDLALLNKEEAEEVFKKINNAYVRLS